MDSIVRAAVTYLVLLILTRVAGRRTLGEMTAFDLILTLIISEAVQDSLVDNDHSMTNAFLLVVTLIGIDIALSHLKHKSKTLAQWIDGTPIVLIRRGRIEKKKMERTRVNEDDVLEAARERYGISSLKEIDHAVLEPSGDISIVPAR